MPAKKAESFAALLRGINVGGKNSLPMKDLAALFVKAGCGKVATYIQSGNVVFQADRVLAERLSGVVAGAILKNFGIQVPVIIRSAPAMSKIAVGNPFLKSGSDIEALHVAFLTVSPSARRAIGFASKTRRFIFTVPMDSAEASSTINILILN